MDFIPKLEVFLAKCTQDPYPQLDFLKKFISNLGGEVPETEGKEINEWFDHFKRSTIVCHSSGHPILELKFVMDGIESKYRTYFEEDCHLGTGGFGSVYKCRGLLDQQVYAVKKVCMKDIAFDKALREVRALSSLSHPNIVKYYQAWVESQLYVPNIEDYECDDSEDSESDDSEEDYNSYDSEDYEFEEKRFSKEHIKAPWLYILMEYCPMSLKDLVRGMVDKRTHTRHRGLDLFRQIVSAVDFIHRHGFLHGDLTCDNIFVDENENVRVGDFGLSRKMDDEGVVMSNDFGMHFYKAPERKRGAIIDQKVDIYSLGVILGELLHPFGSRYERTAVLRRLNEAVLSGLEETVPVEWTGLEDKALIRKLISKNPADRPTAATLMEDLCKNLEV